MASCLFGSPLLPSDVEDYFLSHITATVRRKVQTRTRKSQDDPEYLFPFKKDTILFISSIIMSISCTLNLFNVLIHRCSCECKDLNQNL